MKREPGPRGFGRDDRGQWLILSAIIAAAGLGVIMILLNTAVMNGHSSILSITSFPKSEIRDLRTLSIGEAVMLADEVNANSTITDKAAGFNSTYQKYVNETVRLYLLHGDLISITYLPYIDTFVLGNGNNSTKISKVDLAIAYTNSDTIYKEQISVGT